MAHRLVCIVAFLSFTSLASAQQGPLTPEKSLAALKVADGFQVELFASDPMMMNPTSIDVDHKGRVWVAEAVNYRRKNFGRPILRKEGDRIVVLVDEKGEGKATKAVTFYQGPEIYGPLGVCVAPYPDGKGQKVFVCQSPDILVFEDKDGDLKADGPPKKFLTGFGGFDHDHGVHGINIGPDGKLYFTVGDQGVHGLQSSDGKGRKWTTNDTDCRAGTVWRCDMDGTNLELIAHNFRNDYECCVDSFGEIWLSDNDDDGNKQTRICYVMPGGNYGYYPRGPGQTHWHEEQPGIVHKVLRTGQGSPTGITFYEGSLFPKKYQGAILHCDCAPAEVRWFFRKPKGAGYELEKELLLTSSDNWFRPSDVCVAPDGSIFVADWYDRGVGGHGMGDPFDGRIYRITPKGHKGYTVPEVKLDTPEGVIAALGNPCQATRWLGCQKLYGADFRFLVDVMGIGISNTAPATLMARTFWAATPAGNRVARIPEAKPDPSKYKTILRFLRRDDKSVFDPLFIRLDRQLTGHWYAKQLTDEELSPLGFVIEHAKSDATRREVLLSMRDVEPKQFAPVFYALAKLYDGQDIFYRAALNIACGSDPVRRDAILADFDKHFPEWNDKVADLVWELRPKSVLPRLGKLLADPKLTAAQKGRIVDILAASDDVAAGQTMLDVLKSDAASEVKARAIESLKLFLPTKWKALKDGKELNTTIDLLLKEKKTQIEGLQLIAALGAVDRVKEVIALTLGEGGILDHSDATQTEAVRTLGKLKTVAAVEALGNEVRDATVSPNPTPRIEAAIKGLASMITGQPKDEISTKAMALLQGLVVKDALGVGQPRRVLALTELAGTRPGSQWLLEMHGKGELPKELIAEAGRLLRNSPYADLANRAKLTFPAPGKLDPKKLPAIVELAKRSGDATRGKAVWNASAAGAAQCAKCHMVRGVGGQVGPDLSMIGKKASRENLYESILIPSKAIADQYIQHSVTTNAEVTITGLLINDTPTAITLRDANGKDTTVSKKDLAGEVRKLKVSIMPEDIVAALTEDELADLVAYLETLKTAAFTPDSFHMVGPFTAKDMDTALDTEYGPEKNPFDAAAAFAQHLRIPGERTPLIRWKTIRPDGKGYFDLAAMHGNDGNNSASYMYAEVESPNAQDAEVLLGTDDGGRLWLNGKEVFVTRETKAAAPEQNKVPVKFVKGKNTVLLKVANGNNPHGFYFSLTSAEEVKSAVKK
jgi:putative membrane-bound dehydrogenase-like protein